MGEHSAEQRKQHRLQMAEGNPRNSSSDETESDEEPTDSSSDVDSEGYAFLQPVSPRQRRVMLKAAGVRKIDTTEKDECKMIRTSRDVCGCTCRVYCDPETCSCSQNGIKCQVDRQSFPCGCSRDGCGNVVGRVEFNPVRVQTHYLHTIMRLEMEKKQEKMQSSQVIPASSSVVDASTVPPLAAHAIHYQPQPQQSNASWMRVPPVQTLSVPPICDFNSLYPTTPSPSTSGCGMERRPESLDLQYAYRDDYHTTPVPIAFPSTSAATVTPTLYDPYYLEPDTSQVSYDSQYPQLHSYDQQQPPPQTLQLHPPVQFLTQTTQQPQPLPRLTANYHTVSSEPIPYVHQYVAYTDPKQIDPQLQQHHLPTVPLITESTPVILSDYISLQPPAASIDAINDLLESNRFNSMSVAPMNSHTLPVTSDTNAIAMKMNGGEVMNGYGSVELGSSDVGATSESGASTSTTAPVNEHSISGIFKKGIVETVSV